MLTMRLISIVLMLVSLGGCTEGDLPSNVADVTVNANSNLNGNLTGELWVSNAPAKRFNFQTGQLVDVSEGEAFPSKDGTEYVEHIEDFDTRLDTSCFNTPIDIHKISVKKTISNELKSSFLIERSINGPIRLSPDASRVAMKVAVLDNCGSSTSDQVLSVYSVNGVQLFRGDDSMQTFDWLPDGGLIILRKIADYHFQLEFETALNSFDFINATDFMLTDLGVERVTGLRVNPNGSEIYTFEGVTDQNSFLSSVSWRDALIFMLNIDEATLRSIFVSGRSDGMSRVNTPVFSPDGESLLVTENFRRALFRRSTPSMNLATL